MVRRTLASTTSDAKKVSVVKRGVKSVTKATEVVAVDTSSRLSISASKPRGARAPKGAARKARKNAEAEAGASSKVLDNSPSDCIYLGHIPAGFEEREMRKFFAQFGDVQKVKLFRNKKSLASRGHAYIKFDTASTATTVADTINGYFLGERQLVSHVVPASQLHSGMFKVPMVTKVAAVSAEGTKSRKRKASDDSEDDEEEEEEDAGSRAKAAERLAAGLRKKQKKLAALGIEYSFLDTLTFKNETKKVEAASEKKTAVKKIPVKKTPVKKTK